MANKSTYTPRNTGSTVRDEANNDNANLPMSTVSVNPVTEESATPKKRQGLSANAFKLFDTIKKTKPNNILNFYNDQDELCPMAEVFGGLKLSTTDSLEFNVNTFVEAIFDQSKSINLSLSRKGGVFKTGSTLVLDAASKYRCATFVRQAVVDGYFDYFKNKMNNFSVAFESALSSAIEKNSGQTLYVETDSNLDLLRFLGKNKDGIVDKKQYLYQPTSLSNLFYFEQEKQSITEALDLVHARQFKKAYYNTSSTITDEIDRAFNNNPKVLVDLFAKNGYTLNIIIPISNDIVTLDFIVEAWQSYGDNANYIFLYNRFYLKENSTTNYEHVLKGESGIVTKNSEGALVANDIYFNTRQAMVKAGVLTELHIDDLGSNAYGALKIAGQRFDTVEQQEQSVKAIGATAAAIVQDGIIKIGTELTNLTVETGKMIY